jgi:hypothetical protein
MNEHTHSQHPSDGLYVPWSWCGHCQRAYLTGTCRLIRFTPDGLHPHPATLKLCPYVDCYGNTTRHGWQWTTLRVQHPEYPVVPERNVIYAR